MTVPAIFKPGQGDALKKFQPPPPGGHPLRFVLVAIALLLLGSIVTAAVNVTVDPRGEFGTGVLPPVVLNEVAIQLDRYKTTEPPPDHIVLGSSRARQIGTLPGLENETLNLALHGGTVEDEALFYFYVAQRHVPKTAIVILDQMAFTDAFPPRGAVSPAYAELTGIEVTWRDQAEKMARSLEINYVRDSARSLWFASLGDYGEAVTFDAPIAAPEYNHTLEFMVDGYNNGTYNPVVRRGVDLQMVQSLGNQSRTVERRFQAFDTLMRSATENGTTVYVLSPPMQPVALLDMRARMVHFDDRRLEVVAAMKKWCGPNVHGFDYTELSSFDGDPREFIDQTHYTRPNGDLMTKAMLQGRGDLCAAESGMERPTANPS